VESPEPTKLSKIKIGIAAIPALLIVSICLALYFGAQNEEVQDRPIEGEVTISELVDYLKKLETMIGPRGFANESELKALRQCASMIKGSLGPENLGYRIYQSQGEPQSGYLWETLWVNIGDVEGSDPVIVAIPYGEGGVEVAFGLGLAEYYTSNPSTKALQIVFYPPLIQGAPANWIRQRILNEGGDSGFIHIQSGGLEGKWATIRSTEQHALLVEELVSRKGWSQGFVLDGKRETQNLICLSGRPAGGRNEQAQILLRVMPFLRSLAEGLD